jgi:hypothetical protein
VSTFRLCTASLRSSRAIFGGSKGTARHTQDPVTFANLWERFVQPENLTTPRDNWGNLWSGATIQTTKCSFESSGDEQDELRSGDTNGRTDNGSGIRGMRRILQQ